MKKILLTITFLLLAGLIYANSIESIGDQGSGIDWTNNQYIAVGEGVMLTPAEEPNRALAYKKAAKYAEMDAIRQLLMLIKGTQIDYQANGNDFINSNESINQVISGFVPNVKIVKTEKIGNIGNEMVHVTCISAIYGNAATNALLNAQVENDANKIKNISTPIEQPKVEIKTNVPIVIAPADTFPIADPNFKPTEIKVPTGYVPAKASTSPYTGVIFNVNGFPLSRSMSPKIRLSNGDVVWCGADFDVDILGDRGILAYCDTMTQAKAHAYAGSNPLVINAISIIGNSRVKCDVVITPEDAALMKNENIKGKFLDKFNVIILCDKYKM